MEVEASVAEESQLHELQSRIDELERLHEADQIELRALRESEEAANSQLQDIKTENERLQQQSGDDKEAGKNAKQDRERVETEKRELLEALARSDGDKASLEGEHCTIEGSICTHNAAQTRSRSYGKHTKQLRRHSGHSMHHIRPQLRTNALSSSSYKL
jgi:TolA-binding protein